MGKRFYLPGGEREFLNYRAALVRCGGEVLSRGDPRDFDGLLLPGGGDLNPALYGAEMAGSAPPDLERDQWEWRLLEAFVGQEKPVLGICRGMQLINVYFGGSLRQDIPGHSQVDGQDRCHWVQNENRGIFIGLPKEMRVNSAHHQAIDRLGEGLAVLQTAPDGVVEALGHKDLPILGLQWHPERWGEVGERLLCRFLRLCP